MQIREVPVGEFVSIPIDILPENVQSSSTLQASEGNIVWGAIVSQDDVHVDEGLDDILQCAADLGCVFVNVMTNWNIEEIVTIAIPPEVEVTYGSST